MNTLIQERVITMDKVEFKKILDDIVKYCDKSSQVSKDLGELDIEVVFGNRFIDYTVDLLSKIMGDKYGWISWWLWESDKVKKIIENDGTVLYLNDIDQFYDFLIKEKELEAKNES